MANKISKVKISNSDVLYTLESENQSSVDELIETVRLLTNEVNSLKERVTTLENYSDVDPSTEDSSTDFNSD